MTESNVVNAEKTLDEASAHLQGLKKTAAELETAARTAGKAFEADPTEQAFMAKSVAEQRAKNARAEAERFESVDLAEAEKQVEKARDAARKQKIHAASDLARARVTKALEAMNHAIEELDEAIREVNRFELLCKDLNGSRGEFPLSRHLNGFAREQSQKLGVVLGGFSHGNREPIAVEADDRSPFVTISILRRRMFEAIGSPVRKLNPPAPEHDPGPAAA